MHLRFQQGSLIGSKTACLQHQSEKTCLFLFQSFVLLKKLPSFFFSKFSSAKDVSLMPSGLFVVIRENLFQIADDKSRKRMALKPRHVGFMIFDSSR